MVKLPFGTPEEFLGKYGANITRGGIYLRAKTIRPPGTQINLDLRLSRGDRVIYAACVVDFVTGTQGQGVLGMGLRFVDPDLETRRFLESVLAAMPHAQSSDPPLPPGVGPADRTPPINSAGEPALPSGGEQATRILTRTALSGASPSPLAPPFEEPKDPPKRTGPIIGIDLGTTNSCAAAVRNGKPSVLYSREGYNTVPSVIALNARGKLVVGHPAKSQMLTNPRQTVYGSKRLIGRAFDSPTVAHIKDRFHYEIARGQQGEAAVKLGDRIYSLQQIAALILREVREIAQNQMGEPISRAVITVPAYYNDSQRQAVREAGRLAGIHVERILNEPTAAALAYGYGKSLNQRILVYDLGGGTFDASVLELNDNVYEVISTGGDAFLGGIDFDSAIVEYLLEEFRRTAGKEFRGDRVALQRITDAAERAKISLSERQEARVHVPFVTLIDSKPYDIDVTLTRQKLIELTTGLVDRTVQVCDDVLRARKLSKGNIQEIILVGGQSRFPLVSEKVTAYFGKAPTKAVHPDEAVALGAALLAHSLGQLEGLVLIDVLPMSIGIGLPGGRFKSVLDRNTPVPAMRKHLVITTRDHQEELELTIFQGDSEVAQNNEYLGTLVLRGLAKGPKGTVQVEVTFEVSNESTLTVRAKEMSTGREVSSTFSTKDTPEMVKAKLQNGALKPSTGNSQKKELPSPINLSLPATPTNERGPFGWLRRLFRD